MLQCLNLRNRALGSSHPASISSSRYLRDWVKGANSLIGKHSQGSGQAENPEEIQDGYSSAVVITKPPYGVTNPTAVYQSGGRSATPLSQLLEIHPLLIVSRRSFLVPKGRT